MEGGGSFPGLSRFPGAVWNHAWGHPNYQDWALNHFGGRPGIPSIIARLAMQQSIFYLSFIFAPEQSTPGSRYLTLTAGNVLTSMSGLVRDAVLDICH
jgi:hypothetical protein